MKSKWKTVLLCGGLLAGLAWVGLPMTAAELDPVNPAKTVSLPAKPKANAPNVANAPQSVRFSVGLDEVVKLTKAGIDESVILAFIESSAVAYRPSAAEILKLRELGVTAPVISALLRRGEELRQRSAEAQREAAARTPAPAAPPVASDPPPAQPATPPPTVQYAPVVPVAYRASYPTVVYSSYPTYRYPSYYSFGSYRYQNCYYPRSYYSHSFYPRRSYYGACYSRSSFSIGFRGGHFRSYGGFRHCR